MQVLVLAGAGVLAVVLFFVAFIAVRALVANFGARATEQPTAATPTQVISVDAPAPPRDTATPPDAPSSAEFVRVANTNGAGAFIRDEPRAAARGIAAYPDRTILRIIGADATAEGRVWRNVEDQRGIRGWTPAEFLVASDTGF